ncbi:siderophore-interacting protein [Streptomyces sp. Z26]|uniref:siderophore-interacting protein n=1 Tax=Streptomyces TaxID=1883 RepID=UPI000EF169DC|nr:siderophore-interacting protein [Streptomyces sp. Z26]RLL65902.1 siderophore-interacting protein [Streptomyces sp. Z26]
MAEPTTRKTPQVHRGRVLRTEWLTPHMVRVVLGGDGLAAFPDGEETDRYVKLLFPAPGTVLPEPLDVGRIRAERPRAEWPVTRTYTVRSWDAKLGELTLDFVVHGDQGLAGPWAADADPGDEISFLGPGGAYAPDPAAGWHLLAGDESALPAIAAALESVPGGAVVRVLVEVGGPGDEMALGTPLDAEVVWLHRGAERPGTLLVPAVRALEFPPGSVDAFVHGEAGMVKELRRHLRLERDIARDRLSISGYWRLGHDEDGWQSSKREWNAQVEAEQEQPS